MINYLTALIQTCRKSVMSVSDPSTLHEKPRGSLQDRIPGACADENSSRIRTLLDEWHELLFKQVAKSGSIEILQHLLDRYGTSAKINQLMLEQAAQHGNAPVFSFLLQQRPEPVISDDVRSNALEGGVEIWKAILDHRPELINYDFGEKGDLIAMAALMNNVALLQFFLVQGLDPNSSRFFMKPIIDVASVNSSIKPEILDLLIQYGATKEKLQKTKSMTSEQKWAKRWDSEERLTKKMQGNQGMAKHLRS